MKKAILLIPTSILITIGCHAHQMTQPNKEFNKTNICLVDTTGPSIKDYEYYKQKSAGQKTGAWFLVAGGAVCMFVAVGMSMNDIEIGITYTVALEEPPQSKSRERTEKILLIAGAAVLLTSIPLFVAGRRYKLKARLAMKNEKLSLLLPAGTNKYARGISLTIPFGK